MCVCVCVCVCVRACVRACVCVPVCIFPQQNFLYSIHPLHIGRIPYQSYDDIICIKNKNDTNFFMAHTTTKAPHLNANSPSAFVFDTYST